MHGEYVLPNGPPCIGSYHTVPITFTLEGSPGAGRHDWVYITSALGQCAGGWEARDLNPSGVRCYPRYISSDGVNSFCHVKGGK